MKYNGTDWLHGHIWSKTLFGPWEHIDEIHTIHGHFGKWTLYDRDSEIGSFHTPQAAMDKLSEIQYEESFPE